jgi:hypothetical protein
VVSFIPQLLYPSPEEKDPGTYFVADWVGLRADLDDMERRKTCPYRDSNYDSSGP